VVQNPREEDVAEIGPLEGHCELRIFAEWVTARVEFGPVIRQYSSRAKSKQNTIAERYRSGSACPLVLTMGPCRFGFQLGNLPAHLRNLPLQSFLGHKERAEQVPTQIEKVRNRLE